MARKQVNFRPSSRQSLAVVASPVDTFVQAPPVQRPSETRAGRLATALSGVAPALSRYQAAQEAEEVRKEAKQKSEATDIAKGTLHGLTLAEQQAMVEDPNHPMRQRHNNFTLAALDKLVGMNKAYAAGSEMQSAYDRGEFAKSGQGFGEWLDTFTPNAEGMSPHYKSGSYDVWNRLKLDAIKLNTQNSDNQFREKSKTETSETMSHMVDEALLRGAARGDDPSETAANVNYLVRGFYKTNKETFGLDHAETDLMVINLAKRLSEQPGGYEEVVKHLLTTKRADGTPALISNPKHADSVASIVSAAESANEKIAEEGATQARVLFRDTASSGNLDVQKLDLFRAQNPDAISQNMYEQLQVTNRAAIRANTKAKLTAHREVLIKVWHKEQASNDANQIRSGGASRVIRPLSKPIGAKGKVATLSKKDRQGNAVDVIVNQEKEKNPDNPQAQIQGIYKALEGSGLTVPEWESVLRNGASISVDVLQKVAAGQGELTEDQLAGYALFKILRAMPDQGRTLREHMKGSGEAYAYQEMVWNLENRLGQKTPDAMLNASLAIQHYGSGDERLARPSFQIFQQAVKKSLSSGSWFGGNAKNANDMAREVSEIAELYFLAGGVGPEEAVKLAKDRINNTFVTSNGYKVSLQANARFPNFEETSEVLLSAWWERQGQHLGIDPDSLFMRPSNSDSNRWLIASHDLGGMAVDASQVFDSADFEEVNELRDDMKQEQKLRDAQQAQAERQANYALSPKTAAEHNLRARQVQGAFFSALISRNNSEREKREGKVANWRNTFTNSARGDVRPVEPYTPPVLSDIEKQRRARLAASVAEAAKAGRLLPPLDTPEKPKEAVIQSVGQSDQLAGQALDAKRQHQVIEANTKFIKNMNNERKKLDGGIRKLLTPVAPPKVGALSPVPNLTMPGVSNLAIVLPPKVARVKVKLPKRPALAPPSPLKDNVKPNLQMVQNDLNALLELRNVYVSKTSTQPGPSEGKTFQAHTDVYKELLNDIISRYGSAKAFADAVEQLRKHG